MNLEDLVDKNGLMQDKYSLSEMTFGKDCQLTVVGWNGKHRTNKIYILKCDKCSADPELFGEGYFSSLKYNTLDLADG